MLRKNVTFITASALLSAASCQSIGVCVFFARSGCVKGYIRESMDKKKSVPAPTRIKLTYFHLYTETLPFPPLHPEIKKTTLLLCTLL